MESYRRFSATWMSRILDQLNTVNPFLLVILTLIVNGLYGRILASTVDYGFFNALSSTFGISAIILVAGALAINRSASLRFESLSLLDVCAVGMALAFCFFPISAPAWFGISMLAIYLLATRPRDERIRSVSFLLLALSFTCQWSGFIFRFFMEHILRFDTMMVGMLTNRNYSGNIINAEDGATLQVLAGCSSFNNMSLAFLGWISARTYFGTRGASKSIFYISVLCTVVILLNTIRIGLIAYFPSYYDLIHGFVGATITNYAISAAVFFIAVYGARK